MAIMATYISTTEEEARKKRAATSPMTSLTAKTIQTPKPTTRATAAPSTSAPKATTKATTTAIVPKVNTAVTTPKPATTTAPVNTAVQAPVYGATNQMGSTGYASAKPIATAPPPTAPTAPSTGKVDGSVLDMINKAPTPTGATSGGGGGMQQSGPNVTKDEGSTFANQSKGTGVTSMRTGPGITPIMQPGRTTLPVINPIAPHDLNDFGNQVEDKYNDGAGNGGLDRDQSDDVSGQIRDNATQFADDNADIDGLLEDFVRDGLQGDTYDDVKIDADPYRDVSINHKTDREMDKASRANIMKLLDYDEGDTGDEEAYIEKRVADQLGQQLVGSRASMGRAGFGSSGALYGMEGDQMRQANLDAEGRIYDVREREQNQAFDRNMAGAGLADDRDERLYDRAVDNANVDFRNQDESYSRATDAADNDYRNQTTEFGQQMDVAGLDQQARQGARQDAILKAQMDAINAMFGGGDEDDGGDAGGTGGGGADGSLPDVFNNSQSDQAQTADSGIPDSREEYEALPVVNSVPAGATVLIVNGTGAGGYTVYKLRDGTYVRKMNG